MNFALFFESQANESLFLEANYNYDIPNDKELLMYDFYMMTHWLDTLDYSPGQQTDDYGKVIGTPTARMGLRESTKEAFEYNKEKMLNFLKDEMLEASLYACACELRHFSDHRENLTTMEDVLREDQKNWLSDFLRYKKKYGHKYSNSEYSQENLKRDKAKIGGKLGTFRIGGKINASSTDYQSSNSAARKVIQKYNISTSDFANLCYIAFDNSKFNWSGSYGGKPWQSIAKAHVDLFYANTNFKKILYIDNMYHQQHNTDTMFNKITNFYKKNGGYSWILNALNFKADNKEPYELIRKMMQLTGNKKRSVDRMYIEMLKAAGKESYQEYFKLTPPEPKVEEPKKAEGLKPDLSGLAELHGTPVHKINVNNNFMKSDDNYLSIPEKAQKAGDMKITEFIQKVKEAFLSLRNWDFITKHGKQIYSKITSQGYTYIGKGIDNNKIGMDLGLIFQKPYNLINILNSVLQIRTGVATSIDSLMGVGDDKELTDMYNGDDTSRDYFVPNDIWEMIEDILQTGTTKQANQINNDEDEIFFKERDWHALHKEGKEKFPKVTENGFAYVGKGRASPNLKTFINSYLKLKGQKRLSSLYRALGVKEHRGETADPAKDELFSEFPNELMSGDNRHADYFIKEDEWQKIFGDKKDIKPDPKKEVPIITPSLESWRNWVGLKEAGEKEFPNISSNGFIYIGNGSYKSNDSPKHVIKANTQTAKLDTPIILYRSDSANGKPADQLDDISHEQNVGNEPDKAYFLAKKLWFKLFGHLEGAGKYTKDNVATRHSKKLNISRKHHEAIVERIITTIGIEGSAKKSLKEKMVLHSPFASFKLQRGTLIDTGAFKSILLKNHYNNQYWVRLSQLTGENMFSAEIECYPDALATLGISEENMVVQFHSIAFKGGTNVMYFYFTLTDTNKTKTFLGNVRIPLTTALPELVKLLKTFSLETKIKSETLETVRKLVASHNDAEGFLNLFTAFYFRELRSFTGSADPALFEEEFELADDFQLSYHYPSERAKIKGAEDTGEEIFDTPSNLSMAISDTTAGKKSVTMQAMNQKIEKSILLGYAKGSGKKLYFYLKDDNKYKKTDGIDAHLGVIVSPYKLSAADIDDEKNANKHLGDMNPITNLNNIFGGTGYAAYIDGGEGLIVMKDGIHSKEKDGVMPIKSVIFYKNGKYINKIKKFEKEKDRIKFLNDIQIKFAPVKPYQSNAIDALMDTSQAPKTLDILASFFAKNPYWTQNCNYGKYFIRFQKHKDNNYYLGAFRINTEMLPGDDRYMHALHASSGYDQTSFPFTQFIGYVLNNDAKIITDETIKDKLENAYKTLKGLSFKEFAAAAKARKEDEYGHPAYNKNYDKPMRRKEEKILFNQPKEGDLNFKDFVPPAEKEESPF